MPSPPSPCPSVEVIQPLDLHVISTNNSNNSKHPTPSTPTTWCLSDILVHLLSVVVCLSEPRPLSMCLHLWQNKWRHVRISISHGHWVAKHLSHSAPTSFYRSAYDGFFFSVESASASPTATRLPIPICTWHRPHWSSCCNTPTIT